MWLVTGASGGLGQALVSEVLGSGERAIAVTRDDEPLRPLTAAFPDDAELRAQFEVDFFAAADVLRAALPYLRAAKAGRVLQISSLAGQRSVPRG
ncbi:hypothetical protein ACFY9A_05885 [Streptomyces rubradiris]|uniref:hypothetical protein n=1 Tax=Streptomyces rubradiris TaxID=285531 RepID=UPI0036E5CEA3